MPNEEKLFDDLLSNVSTVKLPEELDKKLRSSMMRAFHKKALLIRLIYITEKIFKSILHLKIPDKKPLLKPAIALAGLLVIYLLYNYAGTGFFYHPDARLYQSLYITGLSGEVSVKESHLKFSKNASLKMKLSKGAVIRTGVNSSCDVQTRTGSYLRLEENTEFIINEIIHVRKAHYENTVFSLASGKVIVKPRKLKGKSSFIIKTESGIASVRGTGFFVMTDKEGKTIVGVADGRVDFTPNIKFTGAMDKNLKQEIKKQSSIMINPGQEASVKKEDVDGINDVIARADNNDNAREKILGAVNKLNEKMSPVQLTENREKELILALKDITIIGDIENNSMQYAVLSIQTEIPGADIYINDKKAGSASVTKLVQPYKEYSIRVSKEGYEDYIKMFNPAPEETITITPELNKKIFQKILTRLWRFKADSNASSTPAFYGQNIIFSSENGTLYSVNSSGKENWHYKLKSGVTACPPSVHKDKVYIGDDDGTLYAVSASRGRLIWSKKICPPMPVNKDIGITLLQKGISISSRPLIADNEVYIGTAEGKLYSLNAETGEINWSRELDSAVYSSAVFFDNKVYIASWHGLLYGLNRKNGDIIWKHNTGGKIADVSPVITDDLISVGNLEGKYTAVDIETGQKRWEYNSGSKIDFSGVRAGNKIIIGNMGGILSLLDVKSGRAAWSCKTGILRKNSPALSGDKIIAVTRTEQGLRKLLIIELKNGRILQEIDSSLCKGALVIKDGCLYTATHGKYSLYSYKISE